MKFKRGLYIFLALSLAAVVLDTTCYRYVDANPLLEIPVEEPVDEDVVQDVDDDKEYVSQNTHPANSLNCRNQFNDLDITHVNRAKEISTPPPKFA